MPTYIYACEDCLEEWKERHSMHEEIEICALCESKNIYRKPSLLCNLSKTDNKKPKVGAHVREFIEHSKTELKQQKAELKERT